MTTKYTVKRCTQFGFAQSLRNAITLFQPEECNNANVFYLHSSPNENAIKSFNKLNAKNKQLLNNIDSLTPPPSASSPTPSASDNIIFVELAYKTTKQVKEPISYDDTQLVESFSSKAPADFTHAVLEMITNPDSIEQLKEHKFSNDFLQYLIDLYPQLRDYKLKNTLLELLSSNGFNTLQLSKQYPCEYEEKEVETVKPSPMFEDIEISIDINDKNTSSTLYRPDKDALKQAALGKATQLDAFSENKFAIIHTKKHAGIETRIRNQNHDVLDTLAINGVMKSPETSKPLSIYNLMIKLEQFEHFNIVFIHPSYEVKSMITEYPCEQIIPSYIINSGELLAIVYRYLVVRFFGYCSIFTDSMLEWRYYI